MAIVASIAGQVTGGTNTVLDRGTTPPWTWAAGTTGKGDLKVDLLSDSFGAVCGGSAWGTWDGSTWSVGAAVPLVSYLHDVYCASATSVFLVGVDTSSKASVWEWNGSTVSKVYTTTNNGIFYRVHGVSGVAIIAGGYDGVTTYGMMYRSLDDGVTWATLSYPGVAAVAGCHLLSDGKIVTAGGLWSGSAQDPPRYYDGSWNTLTTPSPSGHKWVGHGAWADATDNIVLCGVSHVTVETATYTGRIYLWNGSTWSATWSNSNRVYHDISEAEGDLWCCGYETYLGSNFSEVHRSDDGGLTWTTEALPATATVAKGVSAVVASEAAGGTWRYPEVVLGKTGHGRGYNGADSPYYYHEVQGDPADLELAQFTFKAWVRYDTTDATPAIAAYKKRDTDLFSWILDACSGTGSNSKPGFSVYCTDTTTLSVEHDTDLALGIWHCLVVTVDMTNGAIRLYVNATLTDTETFTGKTISYDDSHRMYIGGAPLADTGLEEVPGDVDNAELWASVKDQAWVSQQQEASPTDPGASLVALVIEYTDKGRLGRLGGDRSI